MTDNLNTVLVAKDPDEMQEAKVWTMVNVVTFGLGGIEKEALKLSKKGIDGESNVSNYKVVYEIELNQDTNFVYVYDNTPGGYGMYGSWVMMKELNMI